MKKLIKKMLLESDFDWAKRTPKYETVGEIKSLYGGFRELFNLDDIVTLKGVVYCESFRNQGCVIHLDDSEYEVVAVYRSRIKVKPLNDLVKQQFVDEFDEDSPWIGVEGSDDAITIEKVIKNNEQIDESFDWISNLDTKKWESEYLESISDVDEDYRGVIHDLIDGLIGNELDTSKVKKIKLETESEFYDVDFIVGNGDKYSFGIEQHGYNWDEDDYTYQVTLTKNNEMVLDDVYNSPKDTGEYFISRIPKVVERLNYETLNESMGWVKKHNEPSGEDITGFIIKNNVKEWRMGGVVNDSMNLTLSSIEDLGDLEKVNGDLSLTYTGVKSLGELRIVKGSLDLRHTEVKSLGKLKYVGGNLILRATSIEDLGDLQHVGGSLDIIGTPLSKNTTEEEIYNKVGVYGSIFM